MVLINPMEAAAADSPNVIVGSTQNDGAHAHSESPEMLSQIMVTRKDCPGSVIIAKEIPATINGIAVCSLRSLRRSEDRAVACTVNAAMMNGITDSRVDWTLDRPECC